MRPLTEYGVIVEIPRIYISAIQHETRMGLWQAIVKLIQIHTDIELPDNANAYAAFDMECKDDFERNVLLVRISTLERISGLFEMVPGSSYVHVRLRIDGEQGQT